jgi:hypothetical protein
MKNTSGRIRQRATVTIPAKEGDEMFELDPAAEAELHAAIDESDRGYTIEAAEVLRQIRRA